MLGMADHAALHGDPRLVPAFSYSVPSVPGLLATKGGLVVRSIFTPDAHASPRNTAPWIPALHVAHTHHDACMVLFAPG